MSSYVAGVGADLIDIFGGGALDQSARSWLEQKREEIRQIIPAAATDFFDKARSMYNIISESSALQMLRNLRGREDHAWQPDVIHALYTLSQIQSAQPVMQRWVMAHPALRRKYLDQEVEGYSETYENLQGETVGIEQYDYRRATNGVLLTPAGEDERFHLRQFFELLPEGERELTVWEKFDIMDVWDRLTDILDQGEDDPTSPYGAKL